MDIDISQLRQHLPDYLARVRQGESIRVMSRGRVVAQIVPPAADEPVAAPSQGGGRSNDDPTQPVLAD